MNFNTDHSPCSQDGDNDDDEYNEDLLFDSLLEAQRTRYEVDHMQLAAFMDPDVQPPTEGEAPLARQIAELTDERVGIEAILKPIFHGYENEQQEQDKQRRLSLR